MPNSDSETDTPLAQREAQLSDEVRALRAQVERMNNHRFIRLHDSLFKLGMFQLYRGLAFGLGSVLGATILVSWVIYMLGSINFIPVLGDWATQIIDEIKVTSP